MFVDASAFCAMLMSEEDAEFFAAKLSGASRRITSPMAVWETTVNVSKGLDIELETAQLEVEEYLSEFKIENLAIAPETTAIALDAFRHYGKGRHPAALNFGDCFAYACARHHNVPLLYKGNDFVLTDIETA
jgi:ribonuclease VapC